MSLCDAPTLTTFGLCSTSALHQPLPDVTLTPPHTDTRSVPPPKGFSSHTCHSCITLTTVCLRAASSLPGGRGLCPHPQLPQCSWDAPAWKGHRGHPHSSWGPGTRLLSSVSLSPLCNGTAGFLGGTAEDSVSMGPPGLLAPDAPDASLAGEVPTGWVPGEREATAPQEPRLLEAPQWGSGRP